MNRQNFSQMRRAMIASQLRTTGVNDVALLAAIGAVARERFVPVERAALAYADMAVPLAGGRMLNSPMALGLLLTEAKPQRGDRAMVIGAATGYSAAVLDQVAGRTVAVEEDAALAAQARLALAGSGVEVIDGPLVEGHAAGAPYDIILIDGAVEFVPQALVEQLTAGGRMVTALVERGVTRLAIGRRGGAGFALMPFADVGAAVLPGFSKPRDFRFEGVE